MYSPKQIKNLVKDGKIREALDALERHSPSDFQNDITHLKGSLSRWEEKVLKGLLPHDIETSELDKIRHRLLILIDKLPATDTRRRRLLFVGFAIVAGLLAGATVWNRYGPGDHFSSPNPAAVPQEIKTDSLQPLPAADTHTGPIKQPLDLHQQKNMLPMPASPKYEVNVKVEPHGKATFITGDSNTLNVNQ